MIYVCPITLTDPDTYHEARRIMSKLFPAIRTQAALGCKAWGEVLLTKLAEHNREAARTLDALMGDPDDALERLEELREKAKHDPRLAFLAADMVRAMHPERDLDRHVRPHLAERLDVLPDTTDLTINDLARTLHSSTTTPTTDPLDKLEEAIRELDRL